ncbi:MAG: hypothetical protein V5A27_10185 [Halapricum sp.]
MSQAVDESEISDVVEYRSRQASVVHRPDPTADEPTPACPEEGAHDDREYREVAYAVVSSHRRLCRNPECFGGDWR